MLDQATIEKRLISLEKTVYQLQNQLENQSNSPNWLEQITGSFENEPAFDEVLAYGRAIRQGNESIIDVKNES